MENQMERVAVVYGWRPAYQSFSGLGMLSAIAAVFGLALTVGVSAVAAATIDDPVYHQEILFPVGSNSFGPGSVGPIQQPPPPPADLSYTGNGVTAGVTATITNNYGVPSLSAQATVPNITGLAAGIVETQLTYFIRFNGAAGTVDVPVVANGSVSLSIPSINVSGLLSFSNSSLVISNLDGPDVPLPQVAAFCTYTSCTSGTASFSVNGDLPFVVGDEYQVIMTASIGNINSDALTASASVDPFFDTPFGYTLDISPDIGNLPLSSTPVPAALPLFATGLGGLGLLGWRRKRRA
jgi:hypothetical protein